MGSPIEHSLPPTLESFSLPSSNQRILGAPHPKDTVIPLALHPAENAKNVGLDEVVETVKHLQTQAEGGPVFTNLLARHGHCSSGDYL